VVSKLVARYVVTPLRASLWSSGSSNLVPILGGKFWVCCIFFVYLDLLCKRLLSLCICAVIMALFIKRDKKLVLRKSKLGCMVTGMQYNFTRSQVSSYVDA
jgi:hypothetical protein